MSDRISPPVRLALPGHAPVPARVEVSMRSGRTRLIRASLALLVCWGSIPLVFFIPPHLPWVLLAFAAGIYFAQAQGRGRLVAHDFAGACPRCGNALTLAPGTRINLPQAMTCYHCHHQPRLEIDPDGQRR
jgi:hypothetical protein